MDFKKAAIPAKVRSGSSLYKKRTGRITDSYPDFKVRIRGGDIIIVSKNSYTIKDDSNVLYSTPENDHYVNWTRHNLTNIKRVMTEYAQMYWSVLKPNLKVDGNINDEGTFIITKMYHI